MWSPIFAMLQTCADVQSVLSCALDCSLEVSDTRFGNAQLMDWKSGYLEIKVQRGFQSEFLNFFERVKVEEGSACARASRNRDVIIIDDIMVDRQFSPYTEIARRAGVRAVQSVPLVSSSGALVGVLSTHFTMTRAAVGYTDTRNEDSSRVGGERNHSHSSSQWRRAEVKFAGTVAGIA
jgi:GAF domain-containing protein